MGPGRTFSRKITLTVVREVAAGEKHPAQVCRDHGLAAGLLLRWRREYTERGEATFTSAEATSTAAWSSRWRSWSGSAATARLAWQANCRSSLASLLHPPCPSCRYPKVNHTRFAVKRHSMIAALREADPELSIRRLCALAGTSRT